MPSVELTSQSWMLLVNQHGIGNHMCTTKHQSQLPDLYARLYPFMGCPEVFASGSQVGLVCSRHPAAPVYSTCTVPANGSELLSFLDMM